MVFILMLLVRSMLVVCAKVEVTLRFWARLYTQQPPKTRRNPLPCGKDVVYTARKREEDLPESAWSRRQNEANSIQVTGFYLLFLWQYMSHAGGC